jgi:phenylpropionate dioxygenase-like ring-hydroxylating dioxygenase large terminal subunit
MFKDLSCFQEIQNLCVEKFWHLVCHRSSIPVHGSFIRIQIGGADLFVHNHNGVLSCYLNSCPHRGARIVNCMDGQSSLQCPYHGWSFQPRQTSVSRYDTFNLSLQDPRQAYLDRWCLEEVAGFVFVAFRPFFSICEQIGHDALEILVEIGRSVHACYSSQLINYEAAWMIAVENSLESYHVSSVHPSTLGSIGLDDGVDSFWDWTSLWRAFSNNKKLSRSSRLIRQAVDISFDSAGYMSLYLFPFSMLSSTEAISFALQLYQPSAKVADSRTTLRTSLYTPRVVNERMEDSILSFYGSTSAVNQKIFEEDASISALVPVESWSTEPLVYSSCLEQKINHFRGCCKKALAL